jgi:Ca2+-binding EF-hand superfamily protein
MALTGFGLTVAHAQMKGDFDAADSDHNGRVTFEEFAAYANQQMDMSNGRKAQRFKQLSSDQQSTVLRKRFDKADRNHKGYLDRSDWSAPKD